MKHFLKWVAVMAGVMIVNIIINIVCNRYNVELNSSVVSVVSTVCAIVVYDGLIRREKDKDKRE